MRGLERRLVHHPEPSATVTVVEHPMQRAFDVSLRVQLGPLGPTLISHQSAATVDLSLGKAIRDIERQLERHHGKQRGEPSFGVPSRRRIFEEGAGE
jgi:ribosome-associated translation inhibitor RaiA